MTPVDWSVVINTPLFLGLEWAATWISFERPIAKTSGAMKAMGAPMNVNTAPTTAARQNTRQLRCQNGICVKPRGFL
ncbi:MAG: hypothetical protein AAF216_01420 [Pseudomonadota bacterium]